jgi:hypothetical protein
VIGEAMITRSSRYQNGTIDRVKRANGPDVWVFRWREISPDGARIQRKKTVGDLSQFPTEKSAWVAVENLRAEINAAEERVEKVTVGDAWGHFQLHELRDPAVGRSPSTICGYLDYFKNQILPRWKNTCLDDVKAVEVERWLRGLDLADGTKAKIRNHLSALFFSLHKARTVYAYQPDRVGTSERSTTARSGHPYHLDGLWYRPGILVTLR